MVRGATHEGALAALVLDRDGRVVARAGELTDEDVLAIRGVAVVGLRGASLVHKLLDGDHHVFPLDAREAAVAVAARCVFVVVVYLRDTRGAAQVALVRLQQLAAGEVQRLIGTPPPTGPADGGAASGPAQLQLVELGVSPGLDRPGRGKN